MGVCVCSCDQKREYVCVLFARDTSYSSRLSCARVTLSGLLFLCFVFYHYPPEACALPMITTRERPLHSSSVSAILCVSPGLMPALLVGSRDLRLAY